MKISEVPRHSALNFNKTIKKEKSNLIDSPDVIVNVRKLEKLSVSQNNPKDPMVATKVLDGLSTGTINFSQSQRDAIAKVLSRQANLKTKN